MLEQLNDIEIYNVIILLKILHTFLVINKIVLWGLEYWVNDWLS